jgi:hypothetical protein
MAELLDHYLAFRVYERGFPFGLLSVYLTHSWCKDVRKQLT